MIEFFSALRLFLDPTLVGLLAGGVALGLFVGAVPGLTATLVWFLLLNRIGAIRAATFHFLNPVFGVAIAAALLGERLGLLDAIGVAITTIGILAVQLSRQPAQGSMAST